MPMTGRVMRGFYPSGLPEHAMLRNTEGRMVPVLTLFATTGGSSGLIPWRAHYDTRLSEANHAAKSGGKAVNRSLIIPC